MRFYEGLERDVEPEVDWDAICPHCHYDNRLALRELIEALYCEDEVNVEFISEKLETLAENYNVSLPDKPLKIRRGNE